MERSRNELEGIVSSQKEQLSRYEKRLKDVVTAYKGLLKEKEALETSLNALTAQKDLSKHISEDGAVSTVKTELGNNFDEIKNENENEKVVLDKNSDKSDDQLKNQIMTLMSSLATLSAEKSRMESSFQADKKQLRTQLSQKDQKLADMLTRIKECEERGKSNVDEIKAKWIIERQEREKETNNQMVMIRELQKLYADERHLKENIEMQLNNFKTQFVSHEAENNRIRELQAQLKEAKNMLKKYENHKCGFGDSNENENETEDSSIILKQVQQEMQQLKDHHIIAIKNEQKRVLLAEGESRQQAALHEDRVAKLEARLAELSNTVGTYDRLRIRDQESIQLLKKKLHELTVVNDISKPTKSTTFDIIKKELIEKRKTNNNHFSDLSCIVEEIMTLKKLLIKENESSETPIDISKIFAMGSDHMNCQEEINTLHAKVQLKQSEITKMQENLDVQKNHITILQEKIKVLNNNIDEQENEIKQHEEKQRFVIQEERIKWKDILTELENDYRCKLNELEQQLQKQRQRSLQLLEDKEEEIKTLQTSFEVFHNSVSLAQTASTTQIDNFDYNSNANALSSDGESNDGIVAIDRLSQINKKMTVKEKKLSLNENCHMLHYANEIARKDIEIGSLRKAKYAAETSLHKAIHEKVSNQEQLSNKISQLEEQVDRLERCKTREGANLEYLKNVIISFITTKDTDGKFHMMKAIGSVLQFTPTEIETINCVLHKK